MNIHAIKCHYIFQHLVGHSIFEHKRRYKIPTLKPLGRDIKYWLGRKKY